MGQTLILYRLQQIDSQIDRAKSRLLAIDKVLEDDADLKAALEQVRSTEDEFAVASRELKNAETDVQNHHIKIEQTEASLYGRSSHTPKELQDLQNDVAALKRHRLTLEDGQLNAMIAIEKAELSLNNARENLKAVKDRLADQNQGLNKERETLQKEYEKLSTERLAVSGAVPPDLIRTYDTLRLQKRGLAIATISDNSCDACGSTLNKAQIQSSRSPVQMAFCPSCGRILYSS
jgi:uncharacterized protein